MLSLGDPENGLRVCSVIFPAGDIEVKASFIMEVKFISVWWGLSSASVNWGVDGREFGKDDMFGKLFALLSLRR